MNIIFYIIPLFFLSPFLSEWKKHFCSKSQKEMEGRWNSYGDIPFKLKQIEMTKDRKLDKAERILFIIVQSLRLTVGILCSFILFIILTHGTPINFTAGIISTVLWFVLFIHLLLVLNDFNYGIFKLRLPYYFSQSKNRLIKFLTFK